VKVLIVDDSAVVRQTLAEVLGSDPGIEVVGTAADPYAAVERMRAVSPDVITLDVEMPRMDGLTFLRKLMSQHPLPVVICSSLAGPASETTVRALEYGAVEIIEKPRLGTRRALEEARIRLCDTVKAAAHARVGARRPVPIEARERHSADAVIAAPRTQAMAETTDKVIVIGASTGGTEALRDVLTALPGDTPGVVVVQHMPEQFTRAFATRLDGLCRVEVKEAENGDRVYPGRVLIAPGNLHTLLKRSGARYHVEVRDGPLVSRHRPSVDVLFRSAARFAGRNAVAAILTGMGDDGAQGMEELKAAGARTFAQDERSCVVFGMPQAAIKRGCVDRVVPLSRVAAELLQACEG
jgi:two-component system chemotaxis response regulator CheB